MNDLNAPLLDKDYEEEGFYENIDTILSGDVNFQEFPKFESKQNLNLRESDDDSDDGKSTNPSFWSIEFYQTFFNVDSDEIQSRVLAALIPSGENFLLTNLRPNPDLYAPFWICATLVSTIAICGNMSSFFAFKGTHKWHSNFHLISISATIIFTYAWMWPAVLWAYLLWKGNLAGYSFLEIVSVYGYSLVVFIPISILLMAPYDWLRWVLVIIGAVTSGSVLVTTFWQAVEDDPRKYAIPIIAVIFIFHFILALVLKLYFF